MAGVPIFVALNNPYFMKNVSLVLNGVLLVAVAVLYYFHFSSKTPAASSSGEVSPSNLSVAYINSDSVLKYYDFFKENKDRLEAKGKKLDQDLQTRAQSLQRDIEAYQKNYGSLTIGQAKAIEEDLGKKQQNLQLYQRSLEQELMGEQAKMNEDLYSKVTEYLKLYGKDKNLQVVLKFDPSSDVLYGNSAIDITQDVIKGLNESYKVDQAQAKTKADSVAAKKK